MYRPCGMREELHERNQLEGGQAERDRKHQHDGAADNVASIRQRDSEVFKSAVVAKLDPPRRLHESCFGRSLDELIPGLPGV